MKFRTIDNILDEVGYRMSTEELINFACNNGVDEGDFINYFNLPGTEEMDMLKNENDMLKEKLKLLKDFFLQLGI